MRVIGDIPHPQMKITIFSWNGKYILKFEIGQFEQVFTISEMDVMGLDAVKQMVDEAFINNVMKRFLEMREDFVSAFNKIENN